MLVYCSTCGHPIDLNTKDAIKLDDLMGSAIKVEYFNCPECGALVIFSRESNIIV